MSPPVKIQIHRNFKIQKTVLNRIRERRYFGTSVKQITALCSWNWLKMTKTSWYRIKRLWWTSLKLREEVKEPHSEFFRIFWKLTVLVRPTVPIHSYLWESLSKNCPFSWKPNSEPNPPKPVQIYLRERPSQDCPFLEELRDFVKMWPKRNLMMR